MPRLAFLLLLILTLSACGKRANSIPQTVMLTVAGSFDRQADSRERLRGTLQRRTIWTTTPPIAAREVRVTYDTEQRTILWRLDLLQSGLSLADLAGKGRVRSLGTAGGGEVFALEDGPLAGSLALREPGRLSLISRPYAMLYEPDLQHWVSP
ncbi:hypothetical protein [Deinococcus peraridilitoris]|uniref:Uncharacterized protein n=1 Tax=Deinococcus peraridilitoris (strain DSM 19664 / LMG 22246 / CIP 109416 / KR-200) TaxID=937777 RepID=L0A5U1_DEIPD|nr:hypothetical protein [Deinococcus peraridilitoris]AFZ68537.1 hypothetical protein Deipe_3089 [Deinococcus peraridilitoris DSM 19664]